ncbi:uncharacterized protein MYCFIDRAFT_178126 [Pseudocercospora fijiensis CIRAD86]|uniref:Protein kinase domain-containing protein n=1 Tax=Pseudocercospora fijiensis (strain CIRAD86) TaxID=383855 RepID=M3AR13_PSEFD|nr:uncharacterized protein MYCFIDRAFT_178126 [Pseudocercospora fijiensis CIRAD86]EME79538.1 hypothetical protein MYCFIDRAFT_178126 [Pseudocercospora fijiensis CIRAD86]
MEAMTHTYTSSPPLMKLNGGSRQESQSPKANGDVLVQGIPVPYAPMDCCQLVDDQRSAATSKAESPWRKAIIFQDACRRLTDFIQGHVSGGVRQVRRRSIDVAIHGDAEPASEGLRKQSNNMLACRRSEAAFLDLDVGLMPARMACQVPYIIRGGAVDARTIDVWEAKSWPWPWLSLSYRDGDGRITRAASPFNMPYAVCHMPLRCANVRLSTRAFFVVEGNIAAMTARCPHGQYICADRLLGTTEALLRIRAQASKQSSVKREEEYEVAEDADLLPTLERLRRAFPSADKRLRGETLRTIHDLLNCDCVLCSPQRDALNNARRERELPAEIVDSSDKLKAFSALALSGCLFATREFLRSNADDVDDFSKLVRRSAGQHIRSRLFRFVDTRRTTCEECTHDAPPSIPFAELCLQCAANRFRESIRPKVQLMKVVTLNVAQDDLDEFYGNVNLPITQEHHILEGQSRASLKLLRTAGMLPSLPSFCLPLTHSRRMTYGAKMRDAENEAKLALLLRNRNTPGIAKILMAFVEHREPDLAFTFVNLVFRREQYSLKDYFRESSLSDHLATFSTHNENLVLLEHGLWKSLLDIVEAAASIHDVADTTTTNSKAVGQRRMLGHLDIKPANILITRSKSLLLTDFGQAARRTIGTNDYAPPESAAGSSIDMADKYDIWSLACLLTEALVFIKAEAELGQGNGPRAIQNFYSARLHHTTHNQSAAFWINRGSRDAPDQNIRSSVLSELAGLENIRHPQTQRVVRQIRRMLNIDPHQRPNASACQKHFKTGVGREIFRNPGDISIEPQLEHWKTSFTTRVHHDPIPCRLFLHQIPPDELDLTLECDGDPMYLRPGIARLAEAVFEPLSFYPQSDETALKIQKCSVSRLLRGITLHFLEPVKFFEFMTLLTSQKLLPDVRRDASCKGARMRFTKCELAPRKWNSSLKAFSDKQVLVNGART